MSMTINSMANQQLSTSFIRIATGNRINSAADDAAGLAIAVKQQSQIQGLEQGSRNTENMDNLVQTADGGMGTINDSLQRIRELSLQASNSTLDASDKGIIQDEINQLMEGISAAASGTQFNNMNLLDGSYTNRNTASSPDGSGASVSITGLSLADLGIEGYDVTGDFDISRIDNAISMTNTARSEMGALSNRFSYTLNSNSISELNQAAARSRIADADIAKESIAYNRDKVLSDYRIFAQKQQMENTKSKLGILL